MRSVALASFRYEPVQSHSLCKVFVCTDMFIACFQYAKFRQLSEHYIRNTLVNPLRFISLNARGKNVALVLEDANACKHSVCCAQNNTYPASRTGESPLRLS
jgi:hypothetical protein